MDDISYQLSQLFSEGNRISTKSETERENYGKKLERELIKFQQHFLPHMQEEEDVFQPLLVQHFSVEELKELKESVLKVHLTLELVLLLCLGTKLVTQTKITRRPSPPHSNIRCGIAWRIWRRW